MPQHYLHKIANSDNKFTYFEEMREPQRLIRSYTQNLPPQVGNPAGYIYLVCIYLLLFCHFRQRKNRNQGESGKQKWEK
jgi:hypothetical protein